ncbi:Alpha/beta hydrolase family protein [Candidatus Izimaplasma bacterium HR1]|jgi:hypothetical protein|uniref:alpha/beta hydrolase n=1 Tax=Candidatus Izimoplasma sp. HR1 TaxID=1541959 RepID=UPI0004F6301B|nr:Alpha/beta hydrolase family protein [Candidatus Izimaplasma bacterium HR1]
MKKILKRIGLMFIAVLLLLVIALTIYSSNSYTALEEMDDAINMIDDSSVTFHEDNNEIRYSVTDPLLNIIFIPGGLVTPDSYKYLAINLALRGYDVVIAKAPFNLAILNPWIGKEFLSDSLENVVIGHSLGGVTASMVFNGNDKVSAFVLLGSYPIKDISDKDTLLITAEHDLGMDPEAFNDSLEYVNDENQIVNIVGGNHAQFGWYGPQKGDGDAELETIIQQDMVVEIITNFLTE